MTADAPQVGLAAASAPALGLALLLGLATLGEGGGSPTGLLAWHAMLVLLLVPAVPRMRQTGSGSWSKASGEGLPALPGDVTVGWTLFLVLCWLGAARAPYAYGALLVLLELALWSAAAYLAAMTGPGLLRRLVTPLGVVGALQGLLAVYQSLVTDSRPAGTFLVPNHLALWLSAVLLLLAGRAVSGSGAVRLQACVLGTPALAGIVAAGSRGAVLGLAVGSAWLLLVSLRRLSRQQRIALGLGVAVLFLLLAGGLLLRMRDHDPFRYQRVRIWSAALSGIVEEPLWGSGPGQFEAAAANQRFPDGDGPLRFDRAHKATHSDWLRVPAEFGVPAALVLLGAAILALRRVVLRRRAGELPPGSDGALAAMIAMGTHAVVDNPTRWPAVYLLAAVLAGALLVESGGGVRTPGAESGGRPSVSIRGVVPIVVVLLLFLVVDAAPYLAWREVAGLPRGQLESAQIRRLDLALRLNRVHPDYHMRRAEHLAAGPPTAVGYAAAREAGEHALRLQPVDARYRRAQARIEARACNALFRTEACRERVHADYLRAERLSRYDATIPTELAIFLLELSDPLGARRAAERALALEPEAVLPRLVLAEALLDAQGPSAVLRAAEILREAEEKAARWADWTGAPGSRVLLQLDRAQFERLRRKIVALETARPGDGVPGGGAGSSG